MQNSEKLKDALIRVGDEEHLVHLTTEAKNLTKNEITDLINGKADKDLTLGAMSSLKKLAKQRIIEGKSALPWDKMETYTIVLMMIWVVDFFGKKPTTLIIVINKKGMATKKRKKNVLKFSMQHQKEDAWCWAAVGTSCALFYAPDSGWHQIQSSNYGTSFAFG